MGLLPIIGKALGLFSFLSVTALTISFVLYKIRSPKSKPYKGTTNSPYQQQQSYSPAFQASYYQAPVTVIAPQVASSAERTEFPERRFVQEKMDYSEKDYSERGYSERRPVQQKKVNARPRSKFQILQSTEDGEIKAYHLPTRNN